MADFSHIGWKAESSAGMVSAGGAGAVDAGVQILEAGGNAADAAAATIFALNVTDHVACSIGGEAPLLIYDAKNADVKALSGMGRAPRSPEAIAWYMANGIPSDIKMAPVPSVVDLCITTLKHYGTKSFEEIIAPTLALLDDAGEEEWQPNLAVKLRKMVEEEQLTSGSREEKMQAACDRFYGRNARCSDIADDLEAYYIEKGGFLRKEDLAAHVTTIETPVSTTYRGYTIYKCGPWTQGPYLCQALRLLEGFDLKAMGHLSADYIHVLVEAIKLATADRDAYYGDPEFVDVPMDALLSDAYTELRRPLIDMAHASTEARPGDPYTLAALKPGGVYEPTIGGTTTCTVADRWGNVVSATPSANVAKGVLDWSSTGVTYGNRLKSLNTTPGHPNCIQPGKRPRITLTPTLITRDGKPAMAISVAGGDMQDQAALNLFLNVVEFGMAPAEAATVPRFVTDHFQDSFDPNPDREATFKKAASLRINEAVPADVRNELSVRGHQIETSDKSIAAPSMILIDPSTGAFSAAGDPGTGRHSAGI